MSNAIWAVVFVLGGAGLGCIGYGAIYGVISATMLEPSIQRGIVFGLTFGMTAGAIIAAFSVDEERLHGFGNRMVPWLTGAAMVACALYIATSRDVWSVVFEGSYGIALSTVALWTVSVAWIVSEITE